MSETAWNVVVALTLLVGLTGIVIPVLPGTVLIGAALLVWAIVTEGAGAWWAFAIMVGILGLGQLLKYLLPSRSLQAAGVPGRSVMVGGIAAIVGFFVIPVVGLVVGFVGGVYLAEHVRLRDWPSARQSTWAAMRATGLSMLIELAAALAAITAWTVALVTIT